MLIIKIVLIVVLIAIAVIIIIENKRYDITKLSVKLERLPDSFNGAKIVHLSDTHYKNADGYDRKLLSYVSELKPDYIFFTGDLITRSEISLKCHSEFIKYLSEIAPIYFVYGNHELDTDEEIKNDISNLNLTLLDNKTVRLYRGNDCISVTGYTVPRDTYKDYEHNSYKNLKRITDEDIKSAVGYSSDSVNILLTHSPKFFAEYQKWGADLVFSGHTHGGIVRLNGKGLLSPERKFKPEYAGGVFKKNNTIMIVTRGLGKFRLFNHKEVILCELTNK